MGRKSIAAVAFGLALLVQILAPAVASRMAGPLSPFGHGVDCAVSGVENPGAPSSKNDAPPHHHHNHCLLCQACCAVSLLAQTRDVSFAPLYRAAPPAFWIAASGQDAPLRIDRHRSPRGPPLLA